MATKSSPGERMAFTDNHGAFSIPNLLVGEYSVKVIMSRFLPAHSGTIQLTGGTTAILSLNLQTAMDVFRRVNTRDPKDAQDMIWILRSSRATQPVLRLLESVPDDEMAPRTTPGTSRSTPKPLNQTQDPPTDWARAFQ
jgi:hypothetical protein